MKTLESIDLYYQDPSVNSDKEYHLQLVKNDKEYVVDFQYGRRGSTLNTGTKISTDVLALALKAFHKVKNEKLAKGYQEEKSGATFKPGVGAPAALFSEPKPKKYVSVAPPTVKTPAPKKEDKPIGIGRKVLWEPPTSEVIIPQLLNPIEEDEVEKYLNDDAFGAQEKKDGKHQTIRVTDGSMTVYNKKGKEIGYPSCWASNVDAKDIILDGEAIGEQFHAFDLLEAEGEDLRPATYATRYERLTKLFKKNALRGSIKLVPLACSAETKRALYDQLKKDKKEGIVFKRLSSVFKPGKAHSDFFKCKFYATASVIVVEHNVKNSVKMGLLDSTGKLVEVGNVTMIGHAKDPVKSVIEVKYLYAYQGGCLYQPNYIGPRDDVDYNECSFENQKIKFKSEED